MIRILISLLLLISSIAVPTITAASELTAIKKLKVMREIPSPQGGIRYMSTASIDELNKHYKKELTQAGWVVKDEQTDGKSFGNATLTRNGEYLALIMGGNPAANPPVVMVSLKPVGAVSSADLPHYSPAESLYTSPVTSMYVTADSVAGVAESTQQMLVNSGWNIASQSGDDTRQFMTLRKDKTDLQVTVQVAPAQGGKTTIQYGVSKSK